MLICSMRGSCCITLGACCGVRPGPALSIDTACSSSLSGTSLLVGMLRRGRCSRGLLTAALLTLDPATIGMLAAANMLAPDGRCKTLDAAADGCATPGITQGCLGKPPDNAQPGLRLHMCRALLLQARLKFLSRHERAKRCCASLDCKRLQKTSDHCVPL